VFGNVISLSGSFWWKPDDDKRGEWLTSLVDASPKASLRFAAVGGLVIGLVVGVVVFKAVSKKLTVWADTSPDRSS
jgi:hypothetical protein